MTRNDKQHFASDNCAGICPEAAHWMEKSSHGHAPSYGDDEWTDMACARMRELFQTDCDVYFVFNGTAANALALATICQSYQSLICTSVAHIETDECGAPEFFTNGSKILVGESESAIASLGKISPDTVDALASKRDDIHCPKPKALSITQSTELGTVYSVDEVYALSAVAKQRGLKVHMDGARFANAVAHLGCDPSDITWRAGVDVLCFGGTKNGLAVGEAVVFFDRALGEDFAFRVKQAGQLASKMRFVSAPWMGLLKDGCWLNNARHANQMAQRLSSHLQAMAGVELLQPRQSNSVFARLPIPCIERLHARNWHFYPFIGDDGCRMMCGWDTTEASVDAFAEAIKEALAKG